MLSVSKCVADGKASLGSAQVPSSQKARGVAHGPDMSGCPVQLKYVGEC